MFKKQTGSRVQLMAEYVHAWLHPCLASEQQTVQKNTREADSKQVKSPGGEESQELVSYRENHVKIIQKNYTQK